MLRFIKKGLALGFSPTRWVGLDQVKSNSRVCKDLVKGLLPESLKERAASDELTLRDETAVAKRQRLAVWIAVVYGVLAIGFVTYAGYLWMVKSFAMASVTALTIALLLCAYSVRELTLYAQLRLKRNAIKVKDIFKYIVKGFPQ